jgi:hypothetical protein
MTKLWYFNNLCMKAIISVTFFLALISSTGRIYAQLTDQLLLDLKTDYTTPKHYYITFAVRDNTYLGHAFVCWSIDDDLTNKCKTEVWGFYPKDVNDPKTYFGIPGTDLNGKLQSDLNSLKFVKGYNQVTLDVDEADYKRSLEKLEKWKTGPPVYNVLYSNCIDFFKDIGSAIGIEMPSKTFAPGPVAYMNYFKGLLYKAGIQYKDGRKIKSDSKNGYIFIGKEDNGKPKGHIKAKLDDADLIFFGEVSQDGSLTTSKGILIHPGRYSYSGPIKNGGAIGSGTFLYSDGNVFISKIDGNAIAGQFNSKDVTILGNFTNGKLNGMATITNGKILSSNDLTAQSGNAFLYVFVGNFADNSPIKGTYKFSNGDTYTGDVDADGSFEGPGEYNTADGCSIKGNFNKNKVNGAAEFTCDQYKFTGIFLDNVPTHGTMQFYDGDFYIGDLDKAGKRTGQGEYHWKNGDVFKGKFSAGKPIEGEFKDHNGSTKSAIDIDHERKATKTPTHRHVELQFIANHF